MLSEQNIRDFLPGGTQTRRYVWNLVVTMQTAGSKGKNCPGALKREDGM